MSIEQYLNLSANELPSDPAELERLYQQAIGAEANNAEQVEEEHVATDVTEVVEANKVDEEKEPDGIATKDGKHIISYEVLKSEREQRQTAVREAQELRNEIERLKAGPQNQIPDAFQSMTPEQIEELKEYFPEQYDAIVSQQAASLANQQKLTELEQREAKRNADQAEQVALTVQEEIDNNPTLSHWQRNNPDIYAKCVEMDNILLKDPNTAKMPLNERFDRVAKAMSQIYGDPIVPPVKVDEPPAKAAAKPATPVINSLSDIKGGEAPEASERQRLEDSSSAEIGERLMRMTDDQRAAFLNSL